MYPNEGIQIFTVYTTPTIDNDDLQQILGKICSIHTQAAHLI